MQYKKVPIQEDCSLVTTNISQNTMCSSSACCFIEWRRITIVLFFFTFWLCHLPGYQFPNWISSRIEPRTWQWKCGQLGNQGTPWPLFYIYCSLSSSFVRRNWYMSLCEFKVHAWWSDALTYCEMITTVGLVHTSITSHNQEWGPLTFTLLAAFKYIILCC